MTWLVLVGKRLCYCRAYLSRTKPNIYAGICTYQWEYVARRWNAFVRLILFYWSESELNRFLGKAWSLKEVVVPENQGVDTVPRGLWKYLTCPHQLNENGAPQRKAEVVYWLWNREINVLWRQYLKWVVFFFESCVPATQGVMTKRC